MITRTGASHRPWPLGCPRQDSNLRTRLRRAVLYPLSYGGSCGGAAKKLPAAPVRLDDARQGDGSGVPPRCASNSAMVCTSAVWVSAMERARVRRAGT